MTTHPPKPPTCNSPKSSIKYPKEHIKTACQAKNIKLIAEFNIHLRKKEYITSYIDGKTRTILILFALTRDCHKQQALEIQEDFMRNTDKTKIAPLKTKERAKRKKRQPL